MNNRKWATAFIFATILAALSGCAAVPMKDGQFTSATTNDFALVTFVRESIWMGDGIHLYLWDGEQFIGTLSAGTLVQYKAKPGAHLFMANSENWSYVKTDLKAGKRYFIKANMFPGIMTMRSALTPVPNKDERTSTWPKKLKTKEVPAGEKLDKYVGSKQQAAATAFKEYQDGKVTFATMTDEHAL